MGSHFNKGQMVIELLIVCGMLIASFVVLTKTLDLHLHNIDRSQINSLYSEEDGHGF